MSYIQVRNNKWDWFNARNYCRKRCMDLVSFETRQEYEWVKGFIDRNVNIKYEGSLITHSLGNICKGAVFLDVWTQVQL